MSLDPKAHNPGSKTLEPKCVSSSEFLIFLKKQYHAYYTAYYVIFPSRTGQHPADKHTDVRAAGALGRSHKNPPVTLGPL